MRRPFLAASILCRAVRSLQPPSPMSRDAALRRAVKDSLTLTPGICAPQELLRVLPHAIVVTSFGVALAGSPFHGGVLLFGLAALTGHSYACLALLAHDVAHGSVIRIRWRRLRYTVELLLWCPLLVPPTLWRILHNRTHHAHANTPRDCDRAFLADDTELPSKIAYMRIFSPLKGSVGPLNPLSLLHFTTYVLRNIVSLGLGLRLPFVAALPRVTRRERLLIMAEVCLLLCLHSVVVSALWRGVFTLVVVEVVPILTASTVLMAFIFTNHLARPVLREPDIMRTTVSLKLPRAVSRLYSHFDHHVEHHLFPSMPSRMYPEIARALRDVHGVDHAVAFSMAWREVLASPIVRPRGEPSP